MRLEKGNFYIEDQNSKFGTLVLMKNPIMLNHENNNIAVQVGRTVLSFNIKKTWKLPLCFGGTNKMNEKGLNEQEKVPAPILLLKDPNENLVSNSNANLNIPIPMNHDIVLVSADDNHAG